MENILKTHLNTIAQHLLQHKEVFQTQTMVPAGQIARKYVKVLNLLDDDEMFRGSTLLKVSTLPGMMIVSTEDDKVIQAAILFK